MIKRTITLVGTILVLSLLIGCSEYDYNNVVNHCLHEDISPPIVTLTENVSQVSESQPSAPPLVSIIWFDTVEEMHDFLTSARAFWSAQSTMSPVEMSSTADMLNLRDLMYYYMPSWIPDQFEINYAAVGHGSVAFRFRVYGRNIPVIVSEHNQFLLELISFEWYRMEDGKLYLTNVVKSRELRPVNGVENMYYSDFGTGSYSLDFARQYFWLYNNYMFRFTLPIWVVEEEIASGVTPVEFVQKIASSPEQVDIPEYPYIEINRNALIAAITAAESRIQANYTPASWQEMTTALTSARTVRDNPNATQEQIDTATNKLLDALARLELVEPNEEHYISIILLGLMRIEDLDIQDSHGSLIFQEGTGLYRQLPGGQHEQFGSIFLLDSETAKYQIVLDLGMYIIRNLMFNDGMDTMLLVTSSSSPEGVLLEYLHLDALVRIHLDVSPHCASIFHDMGGRR